MGLERYKLTNKTTNQTVEMEHPNDGRDDLNFIKASLLHRGAVLGTFSFTDADEVEITKL